MHLLQADQAELLGDHDEGGGCGPNAVCELRRATDLFSQGYGSTWCPLRDIYGWIWATSREKINFLMDAPNFPLTSSAMQLNRFSRDFRNQLNKQLHSRNSSPAILIYLGLLSSPKHLSRAWLFVLPHLNNGDTGSALNRSLRSVKWVWGPLILFLRKLRGRSPDARGLSPKTLTQRSFPLQGTEVTVVTKRFMSVLH